MSAPTTFELQISIECRASMSQYNYKKIHKTATILDISIVVDKHFNILKAQTYDNSTKKGSITVTLISNNYKSEMKYVCDHLIKGKQQLVQTIVDNIFNELYSVNTPYHVYVDGEKRTDLMYSGNSFKTRQDAESAICNRDIKGSTILGYSTLYHTYAIRYSHDTPVSKKISTVDLSDVDAVYEFRKDGNNYDTIIVSMDNVKN